MRRGPRRPGRFLRLLPGLLRRRGRGHRSRMGRGRSRRRSSGSWISGTCSAAGRQRDPAPRQGGRRTANRAEVTPCRCRGDASRRGEGGERMVESGGGLQVAIPQACATGPRISCAAPGCGQRRGARWRRRDHRPGKARPAFRASGRGPAHRAAADSCRGDAGARGAPCRLPPEASSCGSGPTPRTARRFVPPARACRSRGRGHATAGSLVATWSCGSGSCSLMLDEERAAGNRQGLGRHPQPDPGAERRSHVTDAHRTIHPARDRGHRRGAAPR